MNAPQSPTWFQRLPLSTVIAAAVALALVAGLAGGWIGSLLTRPATTAAALSGSCNATDVARGVLPGVVTVSIRNGEASGVGSGVIVRSEGYIMTNNHVIAAAADGGTIDVLFSDGNSSEVELVGRDPKSDLAVLKMSADKPLPTVALGKSADVRVGQPVVALGAPLGLSSTVTAGIVSALGRNVPVPSDDDSTAILVGAIQTDASINPGNSGGALVDCSGKLIGINTAIATIPNDLQVASGSVGIGFAVPIDLAARITDQLIETGTVAYPFFGVNAVPVPPQAAEAFGVPNGLYLQAVLPGGPAAEAGLQPSDIVTLLDKQPATSMAVLQEVTLARKAGDTVKVTYYRDGKTSSTTITLGTLP
ncbi:putative trypsin-like serine protease [Arthrobacter sp. PAMC 25486]|uniref:S1C family serine protease n=1 Tax=Arthrobacter sp. PAMC 25486 TaxID=1494608 RepID=UPI0005363B41|nr:trypsin-like peptidase domain-containing protein [Arthrobacter sp. PAMC 25486]AIY02754.1 putative trypsin-like serine protease [Arthrobacter sp. PAMC 25486]